MVITVRIAVEPTDTGYAVRVGPDVLGAFMTEAEALSAAGVRAAAIRQGGGRATVVVRSAAATESGPCDEAGFPEHLSSSG